MLHCINVKLKFAIELQAVYLRGTTYLRMPLFGIIPVVTLFVICTGAVAQTIEFQGSGAGSLSVAQTIEFQGSGAGSLYGQVLVVLHEWQVMSMFIHQ